MGSEIFYLLIKEKNTTDKMLSTWVQIVQTSSIIPEEGGNVGVRAAPTPVSVCGLG